MPTLFSIADGHPGYRAAIKGAGAVPALNRVNTSMAKECLRFLRIG